jgi:hypothetical protein
MRTWSVETLINASFAIDDRAAAYEGMLAILELDRRARSAGYVHTGQWLKAQLAQIGAR